ncbi:MAG: A/G-specific adenine glycosylase [Proteobacteria bacterium]|nr:A/G-specific adenine glycosylase [Pseudomonadota bacterium]MCP4919228.1 A/G-specific adenine glycosylase [Pseudomonadota bacterium]
MSQCQGRSEGPDATSTCIASGGGPYIGSTLAGCVPVDRKALLDWYDRGHRDLPWRSDPTPYGVWLCEVMSQQTRIETMLPYWRGFLARWPTPQDLAAAELDEVLGAWAGLGYYSRARSLHAAARQIRDKGFPDTVVGLRELPGVGPYTAAAIASIAFGRDAAVVDGNVERVICRVEDIAEDPRIAAVKKRVSAHATGWLERGRAGDWNQALMEFGATVCTPRNPDCGSCPVSSSCQALASGTQALRPNKPRKQKQPQVRAVAVRVAESRGVLLARRPETGLLAGLWEPPITPSLETAPGTGHVEVGPVKHVFSHRKYLLRVFDAQLDGSPELVGDYVDIGFFDLTEPPALSTLARKILKA